MVPLLDGEKEVGHITAGARRDGYAVYEIYTADEETASTDFMRSELDSQSEMSSGLTAETEIIFVPPMYYYIKKTVGTEEEIYDASSLNNVELVDSELYDADAVKEIYTVMTSDEAAAQTEEMLDSMESNTTSSSLLASVTDVRLSREWLNIDEIKCFVPIYYGSTYYYGGDQDWYTTSTQNDRGCGPTAMANVFAYMAKYTNSSKYGALYDYSTLSKTNFTNYMNKCYSHMSPGPIGAWNFASAISSMVSFAKNRNITLTSNFVSSTSTKTQYKNKIINGLNANLPVAVLNLAYGWEYGWHWMTITKYFELADNSVAWVACSTWGERHSIVFSVLYDMIYYYGGGVVYFT